MTCVCNEIVLVMVSKFNLGEKYWENMKRKRGNIEILESLDFKAPGKETSTS